MRPLSLTLARQVMLECKSSEPSSLGCTDEKLEKFTVPSREVETRVELRKSTTRPVTADLCEGNETRNAPDFEENISQERSESPTEGMGKEAHLKIERTNMSILAANKGKVTAAAHRYSLKPAPPCTVS